MRVVFIGTGDISLPAFEYFFGHPRCEVVGLVTQPDKPVGRKQLLTPPRIKERALAHGVPVTQPQRIRLPSTLEPIAAWRPDLIVVMAYGQILPRALLDLPALACLNLHASLLPQHRGAAPIQAAIRAGDATSGITVMHVAEGLDTGDILLQRALPLSGQETGQTLHDRLALLAPLALEEALGLLESGQAPRRPQEEAAATYAGQLHREDGRLDWRLPAAQLERLIRAYHPWPGTHTVLPSADGRALQLKIFPPTEARESALAPPGTVIALHGDSFEVATGQGSLRVTQVQLEGRKALPVAAFLAGSRLALGQCLGQESSPPPTA